MYRWCKVDVRIVPDSQCVYMYGSVRRNEAMEATRTQQHWGAQGSSRSLTVCLHRSPPIYEIRAGRWHGIYGDGVPISVYSSSFRWITWKTRNDFLWQTDIVKLDLISVIISICFGPSRLDWQRFRHVV